jgi:hypothetical protein
MAHGRPAASRRARILPPLGCRRAFPPDDPHSDPGRGFPRFAYLDYVEAYYAEILSARMTASAE